MRPLQGRFIEAGVRSDRVSDHMEWAGGRESETLGLDIRKEVSGRPSGHP